MKSINNKIVLGCVFSWLMFTSALVFAQPNIVTKNLQEPASGHVQYPAKQEVQLMPTFGYSPGSSANSLYMFVDPNNINISNNVSYQASVDDLSTRTLNTTTALVGATEGSADVSSDGGAVYNIPLMCPKGRAGMEPKVSINYNNRSGNGLLGLGWSLGGISVITRTQPTIFHDNLNTAVAYSSSDRFMLDGSRLVAVSGTYGANNTQYATEIESFSKILSIGSNSNGPDKFTVETKDGLKMEFGADVYSKITDSNGKTIMWFLNTVTDLNGNYIEYKYKHINDNTVLDKISYTGNSQQGKDPFNTIEFFYELKADSNKIFRYGHTILDNLLLKKITCRTFNNLYREYQLKYTNTSTNIQSNYWFTRLNEVVELGMNGKQYNSTAFQYNKYLFPIEKQTTYNTYLASLKSEYITGDFNKDGYTDFIEIPNANQNNAIGQGFYTNGTVKIYQNNTIEDIILGYDQSYTSTTANFLNLGEDVKNTNHFPYNKAALGSFSGFASLNITDFDGDGFQDLCFVTKTSTQFKVWAIINSTTTAGGTISFTTPSQPIAQLTINNTTGPYIDDIQIRTGDFDGDSKTDLVINQSYGTGDSLRRPLINTDSITTKYYPNAKIIYFNNGNFSTPFSQQTLTFSSSANYSTFKNIYPVDLNGDGVVEIVGVENRTRDFYFLKFPVTANGQFTLSAEPLIESNLYFSESDFKNLGDFNGDGLTDILYGKQNGSNFDYYIAYSKGNYGVNNQYAFFTRSQGGLQDPSFTNKYNNVYSNSAHLTADVNGDGKTDIIEFYGSSSGGALAQTISVAISTGIDFVPNRTYTLSTTTSLIGAETQFNIGDFDGDGSQDLFLYHVYNSNSTPATNNKVFNFKFSPAREFLKVVANGLNQRSEFEYLSLNDLSTGGIYTSQNNEAFPLMDINGPMYVVSKLKKYNGVLVNDNEGSVTNSYTYEGAKAHLQGKGFLGFTKTSTQNSFNNFKTTNIFCLDKPATNPSYLMLPCTTLTDKGAANVSQIISQSEALALSPGNKRFWLRVNSSETKDFLNDATVSTTVEYDNNTTSGYGNVTQTVTTTKAGTTNPSTVETKTVTTVFDQFGTWIPSSPKTITASNLRGIEAPFTKVTSNTFDTKNRLTQSIEFDGEPKTLTTTFVYDDFGNLTDNTVQTENTSSRHTHFDFDDNKRFVVKTTNALNQIAGETVQLHPTWGTPLKGKGIDGLITQYEYDDMGRLIKTTMPDGTTNEMVRNWAFNDGIDGATYTVQNISSAGPDSKTWFTHSGLELKNTNEGFSQNINTVKTYASTGLLTSVRDIAVDNGSGGVITTIAYDDYKRVLTETNSQASGLVTTYAHTNVNGEHKVTITPPTPTGKTLVSSKTYDATGKLVKATDQGGDIEYSYFSNGQLKKSKVLGLDMATMEYDNMGQQKKLVDKNAGTIEYNYNGFGELVTQTDVDVNNSNNNKVYTMVYNQLGQLLTRTGTGGAVTSYTYNPTGVAINQVQKITAPDNTEQQFTYDNLGRPATFIDKVGSQAFTTAYEYDAQSRLQYYTYPPA